MASHRPAIAVARTTSSSGSRDICDSRGDGLDLLEASAKQPDRLIASSAGDLDLVDQVPSDFLQDGGRRHHFVLTNTVLEQLGADPPRDEGVGNARGAGSGVAVGQP
jgi:hypothetical protein